MTTLTLRERRHQQAVKDLARLEAQRDTTLDKLSRITARLKATRRTIERYERAPTPMAAKPVVKAHVEPPVPPPVSPVTTVAPAPGSLITPDDGLAIPTFLQRSRDAAARDKIAADAIRAEQDERKRNKARVRIETMKAKQSGATRKMPLSGREALAAIRG